jgi:3-hydroxymyristoyl/3-hydroxydecanoyl-(acyl carrier protein) dehydratase
MFYDRWLMQVLPEPTLAQSAATRDGANTVNIRVHVPAGSRHFAGHFPNRPILAGVVQMTEIILPAIEQTWTDLGPLIQIKRVKFKALIGPNEDLQVRIDRAADEVRFRIMRDEQECAVGVLKFANR